MPVNAAGIAVRDVTPGVRGAGRATDEAPGPGPTNVSPIAAAADAPAASPATMAARRGERCWAGAVGATVGSRTWRTPRGAAGIDGTQAVDAVAPIAWFARVSAVAPVVSETLAGPLAAGPENPP